MVMEQKLNLLGFSERESRVYLALLDVGPTTTSKLIRKTSIASSKIYDVLEKLEHKGLTSHILRNGKKEYRATKPEKILDMIKEKEELAQQILPSLNIMFKQTKEEINAEIFKGKEGAKTIFDDIIKEGNDWMALGASGKGEKTLPYYMPHFYEKLKKHKINAKFLFIDEEETRKQAGRLKQFKNIKIKFLPKRIKNLMVTFIYADKIAIIPITSLVESTPIIILIKSKETYESQKAYFEWLWDNQK
jgi:HTH-type transcriptional regulator, sugar sensing transcriptional regulator